MMYLKRFTDTNRAIQVSLETVKYLNKCINILCQSVSSAKTALSCKIPPGRIKYVMKTPLHAMNEVMLLGKKLDQKKLFLVTKN